MPDFMNYLWIVYDLIFLVVYVTSLVFVILWPSISGKSMMITWLVASIFLKCFYTMQQVMFQFELIEYESHGFDSMMWFFQLLRCLDLLLNIILLVAVFQLSSALHQQHNILFGGSPQTPRKRTKSTEVDDGIDFIDDASSE